MRPRRFDEGEREDELSRGEPQARTAQPPAAMPASAVALRPPEERAGWVGRLGGNAAAAGLLARQPTATAEPPAPETKKLTDAEEVTQATDQLVELITATAGPFVGSKEKYDGKAIAEWIPGMLRARLTQGKKKPKAKAGNPLTALWDTLFSEDVKAAVTKLDKHSAPKGSKSERAKKQQAARIKALMAVLGRMLPDASEGAAVEMSDDPLDAGEQFAEEKKLVTGRLLDLTTSTEGKGKNKKKVDKWENVRIPVLVQFGALSVGTREALTRATAYYDQLVKGSLFGTPLHGGSFVHPDLQKSFDAATKFVEDRRPAVDESDKEELKKTAATGFSTNIRENRNAKDQLSDHSFGWAVDFDAAHNPNVKDAAMAPVAAVTGKDPKSVISTKDNKTAAEVENAAESLRTISSDYKEAMESEESLAPVLLRIANKARSGAALKELDASAGATLVDAATTGKSTRDDTLRTALYPEGATATGKPPAQIAEVEKTLKTIGDAFNASFTTVKGKQVRKGASSEGSAGSVAAHGFMSLPALFAAALSGSDAGGLRWLQHDRMHFELRDEPDLYGAKPPPKDESHA